MFSYFYKHLLLTLIRLEFIIINIVLNIYIIFFILNLRFYIILFFICISVCERILGLSVLIFIVRLIGNDYIKILNLIKW